MKKILIALLAVAVVAAAVVVVLQVVNPFEILPGSTTQMKEMEKEGWKVLGTSLTLETALAMHNELLETRKEIVVKAISSQKNMGVAKVQQTALVQYAEQQANAPSAESNDEYTTTTTQMVVKGELEQSCILYRVVTNDNGKKYYEFQGYYTITPSEP